MTYDLSLVRGAFVSNIALRHSKIEVLSCYNQSCTIDGVCCVVFLSLPMSDDSPRPIGGAAIHSICHKNRLIAIFAACTTTFFAIVLSHIIFVGCALDGRS